ncbi:MAG TPA: hypothetical protein VGR73_17610 [Bryobacteraceae bacterium]|nr:hypothetical protein [Bryobacteraceae bacterium]
MKTTFLVSTFLAVVLTANAGNFSPTLDTGFCPSLMNCSGSFMFTFDDLNPAYQYEWTLMDASGAIVDSGQVSASAPSTGGESFLSSGAKYEVTLVEIHKNGNFANRLLVDVTFTVA